VRDGIAVALVGAVNVGKSSLLNALIGRERALVDATPGTTRDYVEATCEWDGYAVTLVDTAGARDSADGVERRGIELGQARADAADVVVIVDDGVASAPDVARFGARSLRVRSKADLEPRVEPGVVATSARTGQGIEELRRAIVAHAVVSPAEGTTDAVVTTERQRASLLEAAERLTAAGEAVRGGVPLEMVALEIRTARGAVGRVLGIEVGEDVIDAVFARFCIGK
jgi:tRNA modification GTPase